MASKTLMGGRRLGLAFLLRVALALAATRKCGRNVPAARNTPRGMSWGSSSLCEGSAGGARISAASQGHGPQRHLAAASPTGSLAGRQLLTFVRHRRSRGASGPRARASRLAGAVRC